MKKKKKENFNTLKNAVQVETIYETKRNVIDLSYTLKKENEKFSISDFIFNNSLIFSLVFFAIFSFVGCTEIRKLGDGDSNISVINGYYKIKTDFILGTTDLCYIDSTKNTDSIEIIVKKHANLIASNRYHFEKFEKYKMNYIEGLKDKLGVKSIYYFLMFITALIYTILLYHLFRIKKKRILSLSNNIQTNTEKIIQDNNRLMEELESLRNLHSKIVYEMNNLREEYKKNKTKSFLEIERLNKFIDRLKIQKTKLQEKIEKSKQ